VVVGFPATPLITSRVRFCISAGHSRKDLDDALVQIEEVVTMLKMRYRKSVFG
jgi:serine palmitoyltransferase